MITVIVDYGIGNLGAIPNMLRRAGEEAVVSDDPEVIRRADRLILPGVGAFDAGASSLAARGLIEPLRQRALEDGVPTLGLCLGMELLFERSEEGVLPGLGWLRGSVQRFRVDPDQPIPVPHMGWGIVDIQRPMPLLEGLGPEPRFYFAHSYHAVCADAEDIAATTTYGRPFPSVVQRGNLYGAQFHPEKSHRFGLRMLTNFMSMAA